ncbi:MAG: TPM domain-containing protein [Betaproteobacteria bacterium]
MRLARFLRHIHMNPIKAGRCFPPSTLDAIQREIAAQEGRHRGQLCFVVEAELTSSHLWHDVDSRERARQVFALQGVWNTEENNGVLVYVLLADRRVEIVADRGIDKHVSAQEWRAICAEMESRFTQGTYEEGALAGIRAVSELLVRHFPATGPSRNELPDRPVMM